MPEIKLYIGLKFITAFRESLALFNERTGKNITPSTKEEMGYAVTYPDGYESWSPKSVFEAAYREVTSQEKQFILDAA